MFVVVDFLRKNFFEIFKNFRNFLNFFLEIFSKISKKIFNFLFQNKNVYINLISYLNTKDLLPMIVFIFSRQRCDETAQILNSVDLTSESEKFAIHHFFNRCIDRLTGSDKELPQVCFFRIFFGLF